MDKFVKEHSDELIKRVYISLENQIRDCSNPFFVSLTMGRRMAGQCTDDDLVEIKGYRKGLKVAKSIIEHRLFELLDEYGSDVVFEKDDEVAEFIRGKILPPWENDDDT